MSATMRRIRSRNLVPSEAIPIPERWRFVEGGPQLQLAIPKGDMPRYNLIYNLVAILR